MTLLLNSAGLVKETANSVISTCPYPENSNNTASNAKEDSKRSKEPVNPLIIVIAAREV